MSTLYESGIVPEFTTADRLRKARETLGLDQEAFANALGVSRNTVGNYELGKTTSRRKIVMRAWAMATGVPLSWLETGLAGDDNGPGSRPSVPEGRVLKLAA